MTNYDITKVHAGDILLMGDFRRQEDDPKSTKGLVLKVGRGSNRSVVVYQPGGRIKLITEFDYWATHWNWRIFSRKVKNKKWAREYRLSHTIPEV